ncbi:MAG: glycoside hydrolase family 43 protein [Porphyromonas sp.]|nr:glycoside hydrolase family 43 protein [Porphyromonas sp.]
MKKLFTITLSFCMLLALSACGGCERSNEDIGHEDVKEEQVSAQVELADPFVMLHDGRYYAYGTHSDDGIEVYVSDDLHDWNYRGLALEKTNAWGDKWFWAPEVYYVDGTFYMYYSSDEHICVATSESPEGPFVNVGDDPMLTTEGAIDNSLFIDDDGTPYLLFVRFTDGNDIWIAELKEDLTTIKQETMTHCFNVTEPWEEIWPRVVEGPFIIKHKGLYYMTYSANSYESPDYAVGYATASSPMGPWTKSEANPILHKPGELVGVGHSALFRDKAGALKKVFHAHNQPGTIHPRLMYITDVTFVEGEDGADKMEISNEYITPRLEIK